MTERDNQQIRFWVYCAVAWVLVGAVLWLVPGFVWPELRIEFVIPSVLLIAWLQYFIAQLMHEAVHHQFGRKHVSSFIAALVTAYPIGISRLYRDVHLAHHRYFTDPVKDLDYPGYANFPHSKAQMLRWLLWNISGLAAVRQFFFQNREINTDRRTRELVYVAVVQFALFVFFAWHGEWWMYFVFWILPLITVSKSLNTIRLMTEHADPDPDTVAVLRDFDCPPIIKNFLGPVGFGDHARHHQMMSVPFGELHTVVVDSYSVQVPYELYRGHHLQLLFRWFKRLPLTFVDGA
ncbi:MAG: fatty acid desaturase [Halioglobus sp.]|nr:fatty acid desaturase [Halioglobus sp.]